MHYLKTACILFLSGGSSLFCMFNRFKTIPPAVKFMWTHKKKITATIGFTTFYKDYKNKNKSLPVPVKLAFSTFSGPLMVLKDHYFDQEIQGLLDRTYESLHETFSFDTFFKKDQKNLIEIYDQRDPVLDPFGDITYEYLKKPSAPLLRKKALSEALLSGDIKQINRLLGSALDEKNLIYNVYALEYEKKNIGFSLENKYTLTPYFINNGVREKIDSIPDKYKDQSLLKYACDTLAELDSEGKIDTVLAQKNLLLLTAYNPQPETIARCFGLIMRINKQREDSEKTAYIKQTCYASPFKKIQDIFS